MKLVRCDSRKPSNLSFLCKYMYKQDTVLYLGILYNRLSQASKIYLSFFLLYIKNDKKIDMLQTAVEVIRVLEYTTKCTFLTLWDDLLVFIISYIDFFFLAKQTMRKIFALTIFHSCINLCFVKTMQDARQNRIQKKKNSKSLHTHS